MKPRGETGSGELYRELRNRAIQEGLGEITDRTFRKYMGRLVRSGIINSEGKGRWRRYHM